MLNFLERKLLNASWWRAVVGLLCVGLYGFGHAGQPENSTQGIVIDHLVASSGVYVGSPSITILPDGTYVAAHDTFGPRSSSNLTSLFRSTDRGQTWTKLAELRGQYYSTLFVHGGALYVFGTTKLEGLPVIRRSTDGGATWTSPVDGETGLLAETGKYFSSPVPVVVAGGRVWRAMEQIERTGVWVGMMSADKHSDLLKSASWTFTNTLAPNSSWLDGKFKGWLEGNAVATPEGHVVDVLRVYYNAQPEKAAVVTVDQRNQKIAFTAQNGFVDFPGGGKKFTIRYDPVSRLYWTLSNAVLPGTYRGNNYERARNTLVLLSSADLRNWNVRRTVLHSEDSDKHGFQYADWVFDGEDIVAAVRVSSDDETGGAHSQHDSNYLTFLRVNNFARKF